MARKPVAVPGADPDSQSEDQNEPIEPVTKHGKELLEASATGRMSVAEVMQAIDDGRTPEPMMSYLCRDGYYVRRTSMEDRSK